MNDFSRMLTLKVDRFREDRSLSHKFRVSGQPTLFFLVRESRELCVSTSRSVLDPSWSGLRPLPCVKGLVFATGLQRPCSFLDTSGTRKIQKTASANDSFNVLDKCGFVFPVASFQNSPVFRRG